MSAPVPAPRKSTPRITAAGMPADLAQHELGRAGELVRDGDLGRVQLVAEAVADTAEVEQRRQAGDAERDVGRALAERPPERVADDHADVAPRPVADRLPDPGGRRIRIEREQDQRPLALRVRGVDARRGADEAVPRLGDDQRRPHADDVARSRAGSTRRGAGRGRRRAPALAARARRRRGGRPGPPPSRPPSARRRARPRPRSPPDPLGRGQEQRREVVAVLDLRDALRAGSPGSRAVTGCRRCAGPRGPCSACSRSRSPPSCPRARGRSRAGRSRRRAPETSLEARSSASAFAAASSPQTSASSSGGASARFAAASECSPATTGASSSSSIRFAIDVASVVGFTPPGPKSSSAQTREDRRRADRLAQVARGLDGGVRLHREDDEVDAAHGVVVVRPVGAERRGRRRAPARRRGSRSPPSTPASTRRFATAWPKLPVPPTTATFTRPPRAPSRRAGATPPGRSSASSSRRGARRPGRSGRTRRRRARRSAPRSSPRRAPVSCRPPSARAYGLPAP